jgi:hypothetical protein
VPGYTYYYRDTVVTPTGKQIRDSALVDGNIVAQVHLAYRFPLWPNHIDRKLGFLYFDWIFGCLNFNAGAGWGSASEAINQSVSTKEALRQFSSAWYKSAGAEIRLDCVSFGTFPMEISGRWDWGFDAPEPIGGHRFGLSIGFSFDYWDLIDVPDYRQPGRGLPVNGRNLAGQL